MKEIFKTNTVRTLHEHPIGTQGLLDIIDFYFKRNCGPEFNVETIYPLEKGGWNIIYTKEQERCKCCGK